MLTRILVADPHDAVRRAVATLIRGSGEDWEICCEVEDGQSALEKVAEVRPDLVILDLVMPRLDGISAGREISNRFPEIPVVLFTLVNPFPIENQAREAGIRAVVHKTDGDGLLKAIRKILATDIIEQASRPSHIAGG